jgi:hypothetical protein
MLASMGFPMGIVITSHNPDYKNSVCYGLTRRAAGGQKISGKSHFSAVDHQKLIHAIEFLAEGQATGRDRNREAIKSCYGQNGM